VVSLRVLKREVAVSSACPKPSSGRWQAAGEDTAVKESSRQDAVVPRADVRRTVEEHLRGMLRVLLLDLVNEELEQMLHSRAYERGSQRRGYRHGTRPRTLTTGLGRAELEIPRARLFGADGKTVEWRSEVIPRYARRTGEVDSSVLRAYLSGVNQRRIRVALEPLVGGSGLSKSAVSRVVDRLRGGFKAWRSRRLDEGYYPYLFLDGIAAKVRMGRKVESVPVLVALGVRIDGEKELLSIQLMGSESKAAWRDFVDDLAQRGLGEPVLCIIDGNAGLRSAIGQVWPRAAVQRCVVHKLRNLEAHCPKRMVDELRSDFHAITEARSLARAQAAHRAFSRRWYTRVPGVARSLEEAGEELLTFYAFPSDQWKCLRTTNAIERLNEEFRRRIKTQCSIPSGESLVSLMYGLYESGQIRMRRIDGWQLLSDVVATRRPEQLASVTTAA
jgi:putative transposase